MIRTFLTCFDHIVITVIILDFLIAFFIPKLFSGIECIFFNQNGYKSLKIILLISPHLRAFTIYHCVANDYLSKILLEI